MTKNEPEYGLYAFRFTKFYNQDLVDSKEQTASHYYVQFRNGQIPKTNFHKKLYEIDGSIAISTIRE